MTSYHHDVIAKFEFRKIIFFKMRFWKGYTCNPSNFLQMIICNIKNLIPQFGNVYCITQWIRMILKFQNCLTNWNFFHSYKLFIMCQNRSIPESTMRYIYEQNFRGIHMVFWKLLYFENLVKNDGQSSKFTMETNFKELAFDDSNPKFIFLFFS